MEITAIILAAGLSRRMKRNKLNLLVEGETMLQRTFNTALQAGFGEIILVRSEETPDLDPDTGGIIPFREVVNPQPERGITSSIRLGLEASSASSAGWAFLMGDQPFLTGKTLGVLLERFHEAPHKIIRPVYNGVPGGPVIFPADLRDEFMGLDGDTGGRQILELHTERVLAVPLKDSREALDLDSPEEYAQAVPRQRVVVKGAGDLATGVIRTLWQAGFEVIATEIGDPSCIRTEVSFASAIREGRKTIAGITAAPCRNLAQVKEALLREELPVLVDPELKNLPELDPDVFVDAVIAKRNTGTTLKLAPLVIALGPGFTAGTDCHAVIETMRGPHLADIITEPGLSAIPDTGTPGLIAGEDRRRVIHAPASGILTRVRRIGDIVEEGDIIAMIGEVPVRSKLKGTLRGLIQEGFPVREGLKIGDVDPRIDTLLAFTISDKAEVLGQAVLKAILRLSGEAGTRATVERS